MIGCMVLHRGLDGVRAVKLIPSRSPRNLSLSVWGWSRMVDRADLRTMYRRYVLLPGGHELGSMTSMDVVYVCI